MSKLTCPDCGSNNIILEGINWMCENGSFAWGDIYEDFNTSIELNAKDLGVDIETYKEECKKQNNNLENVKIFIEVIKFKNRKYNK
jgi:hypothetical protein